MAVQITQCKWEQAGEAERQGLPGGRVRGVAPQIPGAREGDAAAHRCRGRGQLLPLPSGWGSVLGKKKPSAGAMPLSQRGDSVPGSPDPHHSDCTASPRAQPPPWTVPRLCQEGRREFPPLSNGGSLQSEASVSHGLSQAWFSAHTHCLWTRTPVMLSVSALTPQDQKSPLPDGRHGLPYTRLVPQFLELSKEYILTDPTLSVGFASLPQPNSIYSYSGEWSQEPLWGTLEE